jgi:hypothetical protein
VLTGVIWLVIIVPVLLLLFSLKKSYHGKQADVGSLTITTKNVIISDQERQELWDIYDSSFIDLNKNAPCKQSFDREHFMEVLINPTAVKYVIQDKEDKIIGIGMVTNDFKNTPWISEDYFKDKFESSYNAKLIYYFMGIAILEGYRRGGLGSLLIKKITDGLPSNSILGFDNSKKMNFFIPNFAKMMRKDKKVTKKYLDSQDYYIVS